MTKAVGLFLFPAVFASSQSGSKEVVFQVDATAKYANLTLTNQQGGRPIISVTLTSCGTPSFGYRLVKRLRSLTCNTSLEGDRLTGVDVSYIARAGGAQHVTIFAVSAAGTVFQLVLARLSTPS